MSTQHEDPRAALAITDRSAWRSAALVVPCAFLLAVVVQLLVLQRFANSGDEYAYWWQAAAFAGGMVTAQTPEPQEAFRLNHVGDRAGRRFGKYPPGWPLVLAAGVAAGAPSLVNPLLAALALAGIYRLACSWVGARAARLGTVFTASTPFFLLNAASYFSHPACLFALTVLALALSWAIERRGPIPRLVAGAGFGLAVLVRPYSALLLGVPLLVGLGGNVFFTRRVGGTHARPSTSSLAWFIAGGLPFALFLAVVDRAVTGSWLTLAWTYFDPEETIGFGVHGHTLVRGLKTTIRLCAEGALYTALFSPILLLAARGRVLTRRWLLWILLAVPIAGHVFWWSHGGNRYGPRFYFEALLPFTMLAGAGLERLLAMRRSRPPMLAAACLACAVLVALCAGIRTQISQRREVYRTVEAAGLQNALVLLTTASGDMSRADLTRNPPDWHAANVLYALSRGPLDAEVVRRHPGRTAYYYRSTPEGGVLWPAGIR